MHFFLENGGQNQVFLQSGIDLSIGVKAHFHHPLILESHKHLLVWQLMIEMKSGSSYVLHIIS